MNGEITLWNSGVWIIPLILLGTVIGLFLLVRYWKDKTQQDLKQFRGELRHFQTNRNQLAHLVKGHSIDDPEPYGSRMAALQTHLDEISDRIAAMEQQLVSINERMRTLAANQWQATVGGPYFWYVLRKDVAQLWKDLASSRDLLATAEKSGQAITGLGWEVAIQLRQARETHQQVEKLLDHLQDRKMHGDAMERVMRQERQAREAFDQVPRYFYAAEEAVVIERADKDSIAQAHAVLDETRPLLDQLLTQLQTWEKQYGEAVNRVTRMRQLLGSLEQSLDEMPSGLDLTPHRTRFDQMRIISQNLHATLSRMEVESMGSVAEEANRLHQAAQEMGGELKQTRQKFTALEQVLPELSDGLKQIAAQIAELGNHPTHPVVWDQSSGQLNHLRRQAAAIGPGNKSHTLEMVEQDLAAAKQLNARQKELARHSQQVVRQHGELLVLLTRPELSQGMDWYRDAVNISEQLAGYDPENWPQADRLATLPEELHALAEGLQLLVFTSLPRPISESELSQHLENTRQLAEFAERLRGRLDNIHKRLQEIQQTEKVAREQLERAQFVLGQIGHLIRSNAFLTEVATQELNRLQSHVRQLSSELEQCQRGTVDKKARSVNTLVAKIEEAGNNWLDRLTKDLQLQRKTMGEQLTNLERIASLDEPAVVNARHLIAQGQAYGTGGHGQKSRFRLDEILAELKSRSDYWQSCLATIRAIEDVERPVLEMYQALNEYREFAKGQLDDLDEWMRSTRGWPPTSISLSSERQEFNRLEEQWEALKRQPARALALAQQLGSLSIKYQSAAERASQIAERASRELEQVEKLERELDELSQLWQGQWNTYRENPLATEDIRRLLKEIDGDREQLRRQYRQGAKNYGQVLQDLQALHRRARTAQVSIDDNHVIDVNGQVIAYR